ncbi:MAG: RluA family pseudouridine synthase [Nitrospinota bacterium]
MTGRKFSVRAEKGDEGVRADSFLSSKLAWLSRSAVKRLMDGGRVLVDGKPANTDHKVRTGEEFTATIPEAAKVDTRAEDIELDIVYQDADIAVINKEAGMVVHPAKGHQSGTLVNALLYRLKDLSGIGGEMRPGIVHRLDKDTSGLIAVAKNDAAHLSLSEQLKSRAMKREYMAVIKGKMKNRSGVIEKSIGRHPVYRKKMSVKTKKPREAVTEYETAESFESATLLKINLQTGRTHQIRVHLASMGRPIIGDRVYGKEKSKLIGRPALHAARLVLIHPKTGKEMQFTAPLPEDFQKLLAALKK